MKKSLLLLFTGLFMLAASAITTTGAVSLAPTVTTQAASAITTGGATLNGTVNANNDSTTVTFDYGTTYSYGSIVTAGQSPVTGTTDTPVSKAITGLASNTTYHYRVVGVNTEGTTEGADGTFTTGTVAGVTIGTLSSTTTDEGGAAATFTAVLDSQPSAEVEIPLSSSDLSEGTVSLTNLTFASDNWNTAQTVTVTGVNDDLFDGDIDYTVEIGPAVSADSDYSGIDPADQDLTNNDNDIDSDGDGISDALEGTGDYDGDGIIDSQDYDPTGYLYDSATGEIVSGGSISVSDAAHVTFVSGRNGADGYYQFVVDQVGTYTITVTPPVGYSVDSTGCAASGTLTANSTPNPRILGSSEDGTTGYLADYSCGANEWYLTINIQDTTPLILNNNIPLEAAPAEEPIPTLNEWGMIITSCLLALAAFTVLRRREQM